MTEERSGSEAPTPEEAETGLGAWILLCGALCASAGHGLFLYARLTRHDNLVPNWNFLRRVIGEAGTAVILWFLVAIPLAVLTLVLRRPLQRKRWLRPAALAAALLAVGAFAYYGQMMRAI